MKALASATPGEVSTSVLTPGGAMETDSVQLDGSIAVIVQFREDPILKFRETLLSVDPAERGRLLRQYFDGLKLAHDRLRTWIHGWEPGRGDEAFREFAFAFNGVATRVKPRTLEALKHLPEVAHVHRDRKVHTCQVDGVTLIGAPQIWGTYGGDGRGVRVAVIDTGIDYTHPDLGGAFGPGNKVVGGYDFVNRDADPKDDNGHGTHVAGIIAANGTLKGVAPGASLLAYKVLDANGSGAFSTVMAGIDRAVDPDQDPTTHDAVQVINLSLGGWGDPNDAISQSVDRAVGAGVVCVVAAGNGGSDYSSILSPGCARRALTVGASDGSDALAWFSSRGPNKVDFSIKPDLTAPGVSINSTYLGGTYTSLSGTSMATPHVAGVAALLLQLHPAWTPDEAKGVLSERAKNLGLDAFTQGGGRVQALPSHLAKAVMIPDSLGFGVDDTSLGIWTRSLAVQIRSLDSVSRTYALAVQGTLPSGISWALNPSNLVLGPGQTQTLTLTLSVDNGTVPFAPLPTMAYEARLVASAADDAFAIPIEFLKTGLLNLSFEVEPWTVFIDDQNAVPTDGFAFGWYANTGLSLSVLVPPRTYNVVCQYARGPLGASGFSHVVREGVDVKGITNLSISLDREAVNKVTFVERDPSGNPLPWPWTSLESGGSIYYFGYASKLWGGFTFGGIPYNEFYFSNVSSAYKFELERAAWATQGSKKFYEFKYGLKGGIQQSQSVYSSGVFKYLKLGYNLDPSLGSIWVNFWVGANTPTLAFHALLTNCNATTQVVSKPFGLEAYFPVMPYPDFTFNQTWHTVHPYGGTPPYCNGNFSQILSGGLLGASDANTINIYHKLNPSVPFLTSSAPTLQIGESPHFWTGMMEPPNASFLRSAYGWFAPLFMSQMGDGMSVDLPFQVFQGSQLVQSGLIPSNGSSAFLNLPSGAYVLKMPYSAYFVNGQQGQSLATVSFDTSNPRDGLPPYLKRLSTHKNGQISSTTDFYAQNQLSLQVEDNVALAEVKVSYQTPGGWQALPLALPSGPSAAYLVDLPGGLAQGPVNLKVFARDGEGNALNLDLSPAYYHFNDSLPPTTPSIPNGPTLALKGAPGTYTTSATDDGGQIRYTFDWGDGTTSTTAFLSSGGTASASHAWIKKGNYFVRVRAEDPHGHLSPWSGSLPVGVKAAIR